MDQQKQFGPRKSIRVICPVYNEESSIGYFYDRYCATRDRLRERYDIDLIFVNNASVDRSLEIIKKLRENDGSVQFISHSRNFGYQASVLSGLTKLDDGDAYVIIDVDCEDPPEMILDFIDKWEQGYDLVYGIRKWRPEHWVVVAARRLFYRLTKKIADSEFIIDMAEFSLFSRRVRNLALSHRSTFPFVRSDLAYAGFRRFGIEYRREPRRFGRTHYNFARMAQFAAAGILSASTFPLRAIAYAGLPLMVFDLIAAICAAAGVLKSVSALFLVNFAYVSFALAFIGIYVARIAKDVSARPIFIVDEELSELNQPQPVTSQRHPRFGGGAA
jgi:dolichol-phosphate mannosyltransferase